MMENNCNLQMKINQADLYRSLYWFYWIQYARKQNLPQEYIDRQAMYRVDTFRDELSTDVLELFDKTVSRMRNLPVGGPEEQMTNACRYIIQQSALEDFERYIMPTNHLEWKEMWDEIRSGIR